MPCADCPRCFGITRQMDMIAAPLLQAFLCDNRGSLVACAMIQHFGRHGGRKLQIYRDAVTLIGTNHRASLIKPEALLAVLGDHFFEFGAGDRHPPPGAGGQKRAYRHPSAGRKCKTETAGIMPEVLAEKLADFD